ncbi:hypothetical protein BC829DRAFT_407935, partial [Chytridium lagenaria]
MVTGSSPSIINNIDLCSCPEPTTKRPRQLHKLNCHSRNCHHPNQSSLQFSK